MKKHFFRRILLLASILLLAAAGQALAARSLAVEAENQGMDLTASSSARAGAARVLSTIPAGGLLIVPDSANDRVMAFDPVSGDVVDLDFIPTDPTHLSTPICAIPSANGDSILVSDQLEDGVFEYDLQGNYLGIFAPAGGVDTSILDNIRGISLDSGGNLLVAVGGGANDDAIAEFDTSGVYQGNFIANGAGGLNSPFDILLRGSDCLVSASESDALHRYAVSGNYLDDLVASVDGFPEQVSLAANGNILVADFSGTQMGILEFSSSGSLVRTIVPALGGASGGYRGVYELGNGNLLITNGTGVYEINRDGNLLDTKVSNVSARYIEYMAAPELNLVPAMNHVGLLIMAALLLGSLYFLRTRRA